MSLSHLPLGKPGLYLRGNPLPALSWVSLGCHLLILGDLPNPGIQHASLLCLLHWQADSLPLSYLGSHARRSILGSGKTPGGGNGNPLQYSSLGNSTVRGVWRATVHGARTESDRLRERTLTTNQARGEAGVLGVPLLRQQGAQRGAGAQGRGGDVQTLKVRPSSR